MLKLLTIDDEAEFTTFIKNYFEPRGYRVFTAADGDEGLSIAREENPHVALVDVRMPGKNGDIVLTELHKISPDIKVIMITASEGYGRMRQKLLDLGAFACFDKPLTSLRELDEAITKAIKNDR